MLLHTFKQARLGLGHCAVYFVGKQYVCENGALDKAEFAFLHIEKVNAYNIARQHIGNALNSLKIKRKRCRKGFCKHRLARAGNVIDKHVSAAKQGNNRKLGDSFLSDYHLAHVAHHCAIDLKYRVRLHKTPR